MGPDEQTRHDAEADAFFATFVNPSADLLAKVWAEHFGNLNTITAETKAYGYWGREMAARAERRALKELATAQAVQARQDRLDAIPTTPPAAPAPTHGHPPVILPLRRVVVLTEEERVETEAWWQRLAANQGAFTLRNRIRREIRDAQEDDRFAARANAAWRLEQRAFERAQWRAVLANKASRPRRKIANQWIAISEDRALAIALAAVEKTNPPQV